MIWIGTSGWVYKHWIGLFYPPEMPQKLWLQHYMAHFPTVEINRSFYRQPSRENFEAWAEETRHAPNFLYAVKASRYITHMKKLLDVEEPVRVLIESAEGLGPALGPFLYQLPPRWRVNMARLREFLALLPRRHMNAIEFREPSWYSDEVLALLDEAGCALAVAVGLAAPTPLEVGPVGPFSYIRFHHGAHGIGMTEEELVFWADRLAVEASGNQDIYVYFNNDPGGHALYNAWRLRDLLHERGLPLAPIPPLS